jgi:hypothetical protein
VAGTPLESVVQHIRRLTAAEVPDNVTDKELLRRFASGDDEAAFAALLHRHSR